MSALIIEISFPLFVYVKLFTESRLTLSYITVNNVERILRPIWKFYRIYLLRMKLANNIEQMKIVKSFRPSDVSSSVGSRTMKAMINAMKKVVNSETVSAMTHQTTHQNVSRETTPNDPHNSIEL
jgi:hypothetical protein